MGARDVFDWVAVAGGVAGTLALLALTAYIVITIAEVDRCCKQLGDLIMQRKQDEPVHGNIMGRIAANLFGRQNNVTDEECVAETARLGYERTALIQRVKRLENDLMESMNALGKIVTMADRAIGCSPSEQDDYLTDISDTARKVAMRERASPVGEVTNRPCTCHPDDNPPVPCQKKYALSECRKAADEIERLRAENEELRRAMHKGRAWVANDGIAASYQTLGQYRAALLHMIEAALATKEKQ